jgi:hypothetical protein
MGENLAKTISVLPEHANIERRFPSADTNPMDRSLLFKSVLHPGEQLLWTGRPRLDSALLLGGLYIFIATEVVRTVRFAAPRVNPLPFFAQLELTSLGVLFVLAGFFLARRILRDANTRYALTDQRLFFTLGAKRRAIGVVRLDALDPVRIVVGRKGVRWLFFCLRGATLLPGEQRPPVWRSLVSGQPLKAGSMWCVRDSPRVLELIETARVASRSAAA